MDTVSGIRFIEAMERAVIDGHRVGAARYLTDDILYAVGARPTLHGIDAVIDSIAAQSLIARWDGHTIHATWAGDDVIVVEVASHFTRIADGRPFSLPCTDIYRFRDGKIHDWRVYADLSVFGAS